MACKEECNRIKLAAGVNGKDMSYMASRKSEELCKLKNRMASASYFPREVRAEDMPEGRWEISKAGYTDHIRSGCSAGGLIGNGTGEGSTITGKFQKSEPAGYQTASW